MLALVGGLGALVGIIYAYLRATQTKTDDRLDKHIEHDVEAHERLAKLETKVERIEIELDGVRKRLHDAMDDAKRLMWELYEEFKAEVRRLIGK
jgi:F0F1-type ATP synthase membrane subunit b/b'